MTEERLRQLLAAMPGTRIAVLGDFCLDAYWTLAPEAGEVSVETGKTTLPVREQRYSPGGAGNVVANLCAIGVGSVVCLGIVGDDPFGAMLRARLDALGADTANLLICPDPRAWQTLTYCKPYIGEEEQPRLDMGNFNALPDPLADDLLARLEANLPGVDAVIVNEQVRTGIHTPHLRDRLRALMQRQPRTIFVFDGRHHADCYPEAWLKANADEAQRLCGHPVGRPTPLADSLETARILQARNGKPVFVTCGAQGGIVATAGGTSHIPGISANGPIDPVGAGDSFLAALGAALACGGNPVEGACLGNLAARLVVAKLRTTGTPTPQEILDLFHQIPTHTRDPVTP